MTCSVYHKGAVVFMPGPFEPECKSMLICCFECRGQDREFTFSEPIAASGRARQGRPVALIKEWRDVQAEVSHHGCFLRPLRLSHYPIMSCSTHFVCGYRSIQAGILLAHHIFVNDHTYCCIK